MRTMALAATIVMTAILPLNTATAVAETSDAPTALCAETLPSKARDEAAKATVDCTTTSGIRTNRTDDVRRYPDGPVNFSNGIVF